MSCMPYLEEGQKKGGAVVLTLVNTCEKNMYGSVAFREHAAVVYRCASSLNSVSAPH